MPGLVRATIVSPPTPEFAHRELLNYLTRLFSRSW
jgi:hypothetical protein